MAQKPENRPPKDCPSCNGQTEWADLVRKYIHCFFCGYQGPEA